jgi:hypothetical protein
MTDAPAFTAAGAIARAQKIVEALGCGKSGCPCGKANSLGTGLTHCPTHDDAKPSLSVQVKGGKVVVFCFTGCCSQEGVLNALRERGLWPTGRGNGRRIVMTYPYHGADGNLLYETVRYQPKDFRQRQPDGNGGWIWNLDGVPRVLYRLPELLADQKATVYVVEGERDADRLASLGLTATTNPGGAGKWRREYSEALRGRRVVVLVDNDEPGREHAQKVAAFLRGVAAEIRILTLPGLGDKQDISDWLGAGHTAEELLSLVASPTEVPEDGAGLLDEVVAFIRQYVAMSDEQTDACALWVAHSHAFAAAETTPYLHITSAEKQSGKSRLLETLEFVVARPWHTSRASVAALVRKVSDGITLLLDETDRSFEREKEYAAALLQILNAGYRTGAKATLCMGNKNEVVDLPVFCAKAIAGLGSLPDTVEDRSILIAMRRAGPNEKVAKLRNRQGKAEGWPIRDRLAAWAQGHLAELEEARPDLPEALSARQEDCWEPLMAIADLVGGDWPQRARRAAITLSARQEDQSRGVQLLDNIRYIFGEHGDPERLVTSTLLAALNEREDWLWGVIDHGRPLTSHRLAAMMKPFGIGPGQKREGELRTRGYHRHDLEDAWLRYLPACTPQESVTTVTSVTEGQSELSLGRPGVTDVTDVTVPQGVPPQDEKPKKEKAEWTC